MMEDTNRQVTNAITVDVEDWFHVSVLRHIIPFEAWDRQESRIKPNLTRIIRLFEEYGVKATFFVLGWLAEKYPEIVEVIVSHGHEIGSHGYAHRVIYEHSPDEFKRDLDKSITLLEKIGGHEIKYYRAPSYSITRDSLWAFEILMERGIEYDSSVFPIKHDLYGIKEVPRFPFFIEFANGKKLVELPPSTLKVAGENIPISGGGYLRLFPFWFIQNGLKKINEDGKPVIFYFHPWELDPGQPKLQMSPIARFRHYSNLESTEKRIRHLLESFLFSSIGDVIKNTAIDEQWPNANGGYSKA